MTEYTEHSNKVATPRYHVAVELVEAIAEYLEAQGLSVPEFYRQQNFSVDEEGQNGYVSLQRFSELFEAAAQFSSEPYIGLKVGENFLAKHWGRLGYLIMAGENGMEGVQYIQRFAAIVTNGIELQWRMEEQSLICDFCLLEPVCRHVLDYLVSSSYSLSQMTSDNDMQYERISFTHDGGPDIEVYQKLFSCPCEFNQPHNKIEVSLERLQQLSTYRDPRLKQILEEHASQVLQDLSSGDEWLQQVQAWVIELLPNGTPALKQVCEHFGQNERTFQRALSKNGITFQELIDELRQRLAMEYIKNDYNFLDVAMMLGYSEQSAFHRAFKRWTGQTPSQYRRQLAEH